MNRDNSKRPPPAVSVVNLPAPARKPSQSLLRPFETLADLADGLVEEHDRIRAIARRLRQLLSDNYIGAEQVPNPRDIEVSDFDREQVARARSLFAALDADDFYDDAEDDDDDRRLRHSVIAERLSLMLTSFPSGQAVPDGYAAMLLEHVVALGISRLALMSGCAALETSRATLPPISAVVEALKEHEALWQRRRWFDPLRTAAEAAASLTMVQAKLAAQERKSKIYQAQNRLNFADRDLVKIRAEIVSSQDAAAKLAGIIAADFEALMRAEADVDNAVHDLTRARWTGEDDQGAKA
jgi:hypothetical protein